MKKEIIISIIIIFFVIIGNTITQGYTKKSIEVINEDLAEFKGKIINENNQNLNDNVERLKKRWEEMQEILAFYIEHDELEKVEAQISMIEGNIEAQQYKQVLPELEKCVFILEHIGDKTALNIKNIF